MHLSRLDGGGDVKFKRDPQMTQEIQVGADYHEMDGRTYPLLYAGQATREVWKLDFLTHATVDLAEQWDLLTVLLTTYRGEALLWKDHLGGVTYVGLVSAEREFLKPTPFQRVRITLGRVDPPV